MTVSDSLIQTWSTVLAEASAADGYYHRRVPLECVWPAHAGIHRPANARILMLETEAESIHDRCLKDETKGYSLDFGRDEAGRDNRVTVCIHETGHLYREIFTIFCADILEHWIRHSTAPNCLDALGRRLALWKKFFQRGSGPGLSREDYVGLYGELSLINAGITSGVASVAMVNAWQAPLSMNQDFLFGPVAVEVKTVTSNEIERVRITNARQLDSTGLQDLFLVRFAFDFRQGAGRTLPQLAGALKTSLASLSPAALPVFEDRLLEAGYVEGTANDLDDWGFTLRHFDVFSVVEGFPRLLESNLPLGLSEVSYVLNLSAARPFQVAELSFWARITSSYA